MGIPLSGMGGDWGGHPKNWDLFNGVGGGHSPKLGIPMSRMGEGGGTPKVGTPLFGWGSPQNLGLI